MAWLDAIQVAELLGVSKYTVYDWAKAGKIPSYRLGVKLLRFDADEIESVIKGNEPIAIGINSRKAR